MKTKEKTKESFSPKAEGEEAGAPAVYELEPELEEEPDITPEAADPVKEEIIKDIYQSAPVIDLIQAELGLRHTSTFLDALSNTTFRDAIDVPIKPELMQSVAGKMEKPLPETERLANVNSRLTQENGNQPTIRQIGREMEMNPEKVEEIFEVSRIPIYLDSTVGDLEDSQLGDFIEDHNTLAPADVASHQMLKDQIEEVLRTLTPREERIIQLRFGLEDGRSRTLEEVGKEFSVTRERIRQIEAKALRKLRHPSRSRKLKDYLD